MMYEIRLGGRCMKHMSVIPCAQCADAAQSFKLNHDKTAAVALDAFWLPIDEDTPRGVSMLLINRAAGVLQKGKYDPNDPFFTHWFPNPKFKG